MQIFMFRTQVNESLEQKSGAKSYMDIIKANLKINRVMSKKRKTRKNLNRDLVELEDHRF